MSLTGTKLLLSIAHKEQLLLSRPTDKEDIESRIKKFLLEHPEYSRDQLQIQTAVLPPRI